jgi:hypothetical protein
MEHSQGVKITRLYQNPPRLEGREHCELWQSQEYHKAQERFSVHALEPDKTISFARREWPNDLRSHDPIPMRCKTFAQR